jgi:hypothetical protein
LNFVEFDRADGVLNHQNRVVWGAKRFPFRFRQRFEGVGDQRHGEPAALLNFQGVVDTPRRARPSISEAANDKICLGCQLVQVLFQSALLRRNLSPLDHTRDAALLF